MYLRGSDPGQGASPRAARDGVARRARLPRDPRDDRVARASAGRRHRRAAAHGAARHRADADPRGAADARAGAPRRGLSAAGDVRHERGDPRPREPRGGAFRARELGRAPRRRTCDRRGPHRRRRAPPRAGSARGARPARADGARRAHPPPGVRLRAQPVPGGVARAVLRARAADLVPRARPGPRARAGGARPSRDPGGGPRRRRRSRRAGDAAPRRRVRGNDATRTHGRVSTNGLPSSAQAVVIGAGIVGNSMLYHLARLGWTDLVLLEKGPLPNPGGSTGHASNFIFPVDHSKEMTTLTKESARQYVELGVSVTSGGVEVARTTERMEELNRRMSSAVSWGEEGCELLTPDEVLERVPFINKDVILGGFYTPGVTVVDPLRAGTLMREYAQERGASVSASTEVTGIDVEQDRVRRVHTDKGTVEADYVFIACGVWSPRIARMAGASIPLTPAVHQMISVGPIPLFEQTSGEIEYPIVRDVDTNMYERQNGSDMEVGSYAHRPILMDADDIPSNEEAALSPTELPFTSEDFDPQLEQALELFPEILTVEGAGIRHSINGLLSLTPDGMPMLGETDVKNLWSVAAVWIKEAPGIAKAVAEWAVEGAPEADLHSADVARFYPHQRTKRHVDARSSEGYNRTSGIVHPMEQWLSNREVRLSPFYEREKQLRATFYETAGWERPWWYESNEPLLDEYGDRVMPREAEWESRWWSPIINAEHLAMRDRVAMIDISAFAVFDVVGAGALEYLQR